MDANELRLECLKLAMKAYEGNHLKAVQLASDLMSFIESGSIEAVQARAVATQKESTRLEFIMRTPVPGETQIEASYRREFGRLPARCNGVHPLEGQQGF